MQTAKLVDDGGGARLQVFIRNIDVLSCLSLCTLGSREKQQFKLFAICFAISLRFSVFFISRKKAFSVYRRVKFFCLIYWGCLLFATTYLLPFNDQTEFQTHVQTFQTQNFGATMQIRHFMPLFNQHFQIQALGATVHFGSETGFDVTHGMA